MLLHCTLTALGQRTGYIGALLHCCIGYIIALLHWIHYCIVALLLLIKLLLRIAIKRMFLIAHPLKKVHLLLQINLHW